MTGAYNEIYLNDGMALMGEMMDYVYTDCGMDMDEYFSLFISTGYAERFGHGNPDIIAGKSGMEIVWEVFDSSGYTQLHTNAENRYYRTAAYWCGWILAYYQWHSKMSFRDIMSYIDFDKLKGMYPVFHETAEEYFAEAVDEMISKAKKPVKLKILRKSAGLSQKQLAEKSGVSLRAVQQYEQRQKNINKAQASSMASLARALGCQMEELLEIEHFNIH